MNLNLKNNKILRQLVQSKKKLFQYSFCSISSYLEAYDNKYFCTPISDSWNYTGCILLSKQIGDELTCLIGIKALMPQPYIGYCTQQIPYCGACYFVDWETSNFCLLCENGYYNDYYTSYCKPCPSECTLCVETDSSKLLKSASSVVIQILLNEALINYNALTRNPNQNEVRVKCTQCQEGYEIYFDKCIEQCPNNCKSCKIIDYKQICITCKQNIDQNRQIYNGKCIQCPYNCKLCLPREDEDKYSINPYFNNSITYQICIIQLSILLKKFNFLLIQNYHNDSFQIIFFFSHLYIYFEEKISQNSLVYLNYSIYYYIWEQFKFEFLAKSKFYKIIHKSIKQKSQQNNIQYVYQNLGFDEYHLIDKNMGNKCAQKILKP